ncbi:outer membrane channel protein [Salinivirga cyanobacteriivorans]|uniref:Outer membrane channel protein n=1 Tax=Salinivirga cyanobacteriivorans TaxID=1307839 RepID=A0A0S2HWX6_9BACT|nr:TolC family protein [Salinivirga cyanobacteriivorans]ALO14550.1 outer membrane channel protein [Salinivirga cyanobacteriivorans]
MTRKIYILSFLLFPYLTFAQGENTSKDTLKLTLNQVVERLKTDNLHIKASQHQLSRAQKEREAQKGLYYPKLDVGATFTQMSEPLELDLTPVKDAILPAYELIGGQNELLGNLTDYMASTGTLDPTTYQSFNNGISQMEMGREGAVSAINDGEWVKTIQDNQFAVVDASLTWPIYTGGKIRAANKAAEARLEATQAKNQDVVAKEITSVVERYFGLRLAMNVEKVRKQVVEGMEKHLHDARKLEENGMIAHAERLHAEVALVEAQRALKKAKNTVELTQTALQNSLTTEAVIDPKTDLFISAKTLNLKDMIQHAQQENPAIKQLQAKAKLAKQGIKKEQAAWYPNVFAFGQADIANYQLSEYMPEWMVGVGLKLNVFDGLAKLRKTQAAKLQHMEVQVWQDKAKLDLATGVTKIYQQMEQAADNYESAQTSIKFAKEYLRIREKAFSQGFATSTDVVDAQLNLAKVETEKLKAMYDFDVALAKFLEFGYRSEEITDFVQQDNN